jgi:hypothetical protein
VDRSHAQRMVAPRGPPSEHHRTVTSGRFGGSSGQPAVIADPGTKALRRHDRSPTESRSRRSVLPAVHVRVAHSGACSVRAPGAQIAKSVPPACDPMTVGPCKAEPMAAMTIGGGRRRPGSGWCIVLSSGTSEMGTDTSASLW